MLRSPWIIYALTYKIKDIYSDNYWTLAHDDVGRVAIFISSSIT